MTYKVVSGADFRRDFAEAQTVLWDHMDAVEEEVKSRPISKGEDVSALARRCFENLKHQMEGESELNSFVTAMLLNSVQAFFEASLCVPGDLKRYQANPEVKPKLVWVKMWNEELGIK